jgi:sulfite exporter TauE/SafE
MEIVSGLIMGLVGSLHCLGMCGPIAIAIPARSDNKLTIIIDSLLYNFGRVVTYMVMGLIVGLLGSTISLAGYQEIISIVAGALLLIIVIIPRKWEVAIGNISFIKAGSDKLMKAFRSILGKKSMGSLFAIGLLNGLLPCGLVYAALIAALAFGSVLGSITFMMFFGIGTVPMLAVVFSIKGMLSVEIRRKINKLIPVGIAIVAIILILRGMSLGIPYISPVLPDQVEQKTECCH